MTITNGYTDLTSLTSAARIADTVDDSLLELSIETASRMVDAYCERRFWTNGTESRVYSAEDCYYLDVDDIAGTALTVKTSSALDRTYDVTWAAADYQTESPNRFTSGVAFPITRLRAVGSYLFYPSHETTVQVTATFGFGTAVPSEIKHATTILALRQFKRYDSPTGVLGFGDFGPVRVGSKLDPDVAMILAPFRRNPIGLA